MAEKFQPGLSRLPVKSYLSGRIKPASKVTSVSVTNHSKQVQDKPVSQVGGMSSVKSVKPSCTSSTSRKRTAAALSGPSETSHGGKRPLLISNHQKGLRPKQDLKKESQTKSVTVKPDISNRPKKWDTKGQLEEEKRKVLNLTSQLQSLRSEQENFETVKIEMNQLRLSLEEKENELKSAFDEMDKMQKVSNLYENLLLEHNKLQTLYSDLQRNFKLLVSEKEGLTKSLQEAVEKTEVHLKCIKDLQSQLESSNSQCASLESLIISLQDDQFNSNLIRKSLHNQIMDLKGSIRVYCRVRPLLDNEMNEKEYSINYPNLETIEIQISDAVTKTPGKSHLPKRKPEKKCFSVNRVFAPNASQEHIFSDTLELIQSVLDGYNVCVLAYGITGSGKTYTMEGEDLEYRGVIPRGIDAIFEGVEKMKKMGWMHSISLCCFEVYNEEIHDLINPRKKVPFEIKLSNKPYEELYVTNLEVKEITNASEAHSLLEIAKRNRCVAATKRNEFSSRSHSITKVSVMGENSKRKESSYGALYLVDLAGSEKMDDENGEVRTKETTNINSSLSQLRTVIDRLAAKKKTDQIDYRSSKLTHILKPCLGGNSKTLVMVTLSPLQEHIHESIASLRFAVALSSCKQKIVRQLKS